MNKIKNWPHEFPGAYWLGREEETAVRDVLRRGSLFRYYGIGAAKYADRYEAAARRFYGARFALGVNSGSGALFTCLRALDIGPGCEVIVPAFLWVATVSAVVHAGAIPVLCEVDESFTMDPRDLARKITPRTKLILPIHMAGAPCNMGAIMKIARQHGIPVLEDCAQANGGSYRGRKLGTFGAMGIFSLQLNKNMTSGEGGLLITNDEQLFHRAFSAHDMGMVRINGRLAMPAPGAVMWGEGRRMTELCGAVAGAQLRKLPRIVAHMRASKRRIKQQLPGLNFRRMNDARGDTGPFLIFLMPDRAQAERATQRLVEAGIHNAKHLAKYGLHLYYNIPGLVNKTPLSSAGDPWKLAQNAKSRTSYRKGTCPASDALFERGVMVPIPSRLTRRQEAQAVAAIRWATAP